MLSAVAWWPGIVLLQVDNAKRHTAYTATALLDAGLGPCAPPATETPPTSTIWQAMSVIAV